MLTFIYSFPILIIKGSNNLYRFFYLVFSAIFIVIIFQLTELFTGFKIGNIKGEVYESTFEWEFIRLIYSPFLGIICFIFGLYFYTSKEGYFFNRVYLVLVITMSAFSIVLSATRGWIIAYAVMFMLYAFYFFRKFQSALKYILPGLLILIIVYEYSTTFHYVMDNIFSRIDTISNIAGGDITAGGTLGRIELRIPRLLSKAMDYLILGAGFTDYYYLYGDNHVGPVNLLFQVGTVGIFIFIMFIFNYYKVVMLRIKRYHKKEFFVFIVGITGLLVINATSTQIFGYTNLGAQRESFELLAIFFGASDILMKYNVMQESGIETNRNIDPIEKIYNAR